MVTMSASTDIQDTPSDSLTIAPDPEVESKTSSLSGKYIMYITVGTIGFLDNLLVVVVIATSRSMRKRYTNWFLINQSVIDMLTAGTLAVQAYEPELRVSGVAGFIYCKLWYSSLFLWAFAMTSTYNLIVITLERYIAIVHPVWHKNHVTWKLVAVGLASPWIIAYTFTIHIPVLADFDWDDLTCRTLQFRSRLQGQIVGVTTFILQYLVPMTTMIGCYTSMVLVLKGSGSGNEETGMNKTRAQARENVLKILVTVCVAFFLCWSWNQVFFLLYNVGVAVKFGTPFYLFTVVAAHLNCAINPLIYATKYQAFRKAFMQLFCRNQVAPYRDSSQMTGSTA